MDDKEKIAWMLKGVLPNEGDYILAVRRGDDIDLKIGRMVDTDLDAELKQKVKAWMIRIKRVLATPVGRKRK